jgi:cell division protein FtsB
MGESSVVRVTRRSERWAADDGSGFRLVLERDEAPNPSFGERGPVGERPAEHPLATDYGWNATRAHTGASDRRSRALAAGGGRSGLQGVALSGSRSRRNAIRSGISAIPRGIASLIEGTLGHTRGVTVLVVVALVVAMLYTPLCNLYAAHRRLGHLQATYDALLAENESINHDLEVLQSREGIENVARARGYVEAGETKVIVEGLADEGQQEDQALAAISDVEVPDERPWYIVALDTLFGYTAEQ